ASVDLLFVKGLTLGKLAYDNPHLKMDADIDILVSPEVIAEAAATLARLGYRPILPSTIDTVARWHRRKKESVWRKEGIQLDLHSRLANNPSLIPNIGMQSPRQNIDVGGGIVLPTLNDKPLFLYLCVHGASSAWFRLKWIADLSAFLSKPSRLEMLERYNSDSEWSANRSVLQALFLAQQLFHVPVGKVLEGTNRGLAERMLAKVALAQLIEPLEPTERKLGTLSIHLSQFILKRGFRFKWSELVTQLLT
ncbi:MAG: nucleotidyltransferase family protein, partial [Sphingomicrobium sp.]